VAASIIAAAFITYGGPNATSNRNQMKQPAFFLPNSALRLAMAST